MDGFVLLPIIATFCFLGASLFLLYSDDIRVCPGSVAPIYRSSDRASQNDVARFAGYVIGARSVEVRQEFSKETLLNSAFNGNHCSDE